MSTNATEIENSRVFRDEDFFHPGRRFAQTFFQGGGIVFWCFAFPPLLLTLILPNLLPQWFGSLSGYADLISLPFLLMILPSYGHHVLWPVAKPIVEKGLDYNNKKPGMTNDYEKAGGIAWMGTVRKGKNGGNPHS